MKRLKAYAVLACALVMIWSQVAQPYCAYALSAESGAISQSTSQASEERVSQDEISQGTQDDASDSQGQTEWYGDDANAARPDEDSDFISDDQAGVGADEPGTDDSDGEASGDVSIETDSSESDSLEPNSWRYENGVLINAGSDDIDAQSLSDDALPNGAVARGIDVSNHQGTVDWNKVKAAGIDFAILKFDLFTENLTILLRGMLLNVSASVFLMVCITTPTPVL